jgi:ketosteroid isomerase-like protein
VADRVEEHFRLFNDAVRTRDWTAFLATFTPDAVMRWVAELTVAFDAS